MFRCAVRLCLRMRALIVIFLRRIIRGEGGKEKILLVRGEVETLLVEGIIVRHDDEGVLRITDVDLSRK